MLSEIIKIILKHADPERIYLFGSQGTKEANQSSDIDIAYDDKNFRNHELIAEELNKLNTLRKIDVKNIAFAGERFRNRVVSTGKVLYSKSKKL